MVKWGCGESPNYCTIPSAVPLFWELKQFSLWMLAMLCYCPAGVFFYHYRFSQKVQPCTQSTSTSIKMHYSLYGFIVFK